MARWICSCCGQWFKDNDNEKQLAFDKDRGYGLCPGCEKWEREMFYTPLIKQVAENLNPENRKKFEAMERERQEYIVAKMIDEDIISFSYSINKPGAEDSQGVTS